MHFPQIAGLFAAALVTFQAGVVFAAAPPEDYELSWADEFNGKELDATKWDFKFKEGYHILGVEWTPEEYVFNIDGKEVWRTKDAVSHLKEYIILSMDVYTWGGDIGKAQLPDSCCFDYVRVYKKRDAANPVKAPAEKTP